MNNYPFFVESNPSNTHTTPSSWMGSVPKDGYEDLTNRISVCMGIRIGPY